MERLTERITRQDSYGLFQPRVDTGASSALECSRGKLREFNVGDAVTVRERQVQRNLTGRQHNERAETGASQKLGNIQEGGPAQVVSAREDGTYSVKYALRNAQEDGVSAQYIVMQEDKSSGRRSKRSCTDQARRTYDPSAEAAKPQLCKQEAQPGQSVQAEAGIPPPQNATALDLMFIKTKVATRVYAQDGTRSHDVTGLAAPKLFPDWAKYRHDVELMCRPGLDRETPSNTPGSFHRESQRLLEFAKSAIDVVSLRQESERTHLGKQARYARRIRRNQLAAMQGTWRQKPFALRKYVPLTR